MDKITETVNVEKLALDLLSDRRHGAVKRRRGGTEEARMNSVKGTKIF